MDENGPVLDQFNLVVRDMTASVAFYRRLGLEVPDAEPEWQGHHRSVKFPSGLDLDLDSLEFAQTWNAGWVDRGRSGMGVLGFRMASRDAVDATYADLTGAGYESQQAPYDTFWGARFAVVADPDGNAVGLMSPVDPERRSRPSLPGAG